MSQQHNTETIPSDKKYPKLSKPTSGYLEIDFFKNSDLRSGYFCYNCAYFTVEKHCAIVEDKGQDIRGEESGIIAPHGICTLWAPNEERTR